MVMKVYGSMISTATLRVLVCLAEKDIDFELIHVDLASGEHKKPHLLSINPFGQIPAVEDGDFKLIESRAIMQYIERTYVKQGTDLISKEPKKAAEQSVWMEVESQKFEPATTRLVWELCMKRLLFGEKENQAVVKVKEEALGNLLDVYEGRLTENKYLGGDSFSMADLYHVPVIKFLMGTQTKKVFDARPHVSAWITDILSRPSCLKVFCRSANQLGA
ncbi:unnamed protein product [Lactuca virosa]|uniref:glutathione transferase n=1 Tax=Lactuca virosa TaxID=75947 RepID=A0AAU9N411_9ASTR|nr:unnamed protein product [Lactuca virosa]